MNIGKAFTQRNMGAAYSYFYIHFITEVVCFFALKKLVGDSFILWATPLIYDFLAFVPQGIIGILSDKFPKFKPGIIGTVLLAAGFILYELSSLTVIPIMIIAIGNAFIHVNGAEVTLRVSSGKMSHAAIFVAGGSFGVLTGKLLATYNVSWIIVAVAILTMIPYFVIADRYTKETVLTGFNYSDSDKATWFVIVAATLIVAVRGFIGYGIPTSWNKTVVQTIALYVAMGVGKGMGGILIDTIGMKKTALLSILLSIPFLVFGDNLMAVSLIGVFLFSMTMPVTLGILVSVLNDMPGLAFGFTTLGLFLGTVPIFFFKLKNLMVNCVMIALFGIGCFVLAKMIIGEKK